MTADRDSRISAILAPSSVVVVGASDERPGSMPAAPVQNLLHHGYRGTIYVVNPNRGTVCGIPTYPTIGDLPEVPQTAVVVVGADRVPGVIYELGAFGVGSATVVAAGFDEAAAGAAGVRRTAALKEAIRDTKLRLLGPNTTGVINTLDSYVPRASRNHPPQLRPGSFAIVGQSGALGNGAFNRALRYGTGVGYVVATGNQLDIDIWDVATHVLADERIACVGLLVESLTRPDKVRSTARFARDRGKALIVLQLGVSERGMAVVATHSGSLAGAAEIATDFFARLGIIQVYELDQLWEVGQLFDAWGVPSGSVDRLAVLSTSGGEAALSADIAADTPLTMPPPSPSTAAAIRAGFSFAEPGNPFDLTAEFMGRPGQIELATRAMLADPAFDMVLFSSLVTVGRYAEAMYEELSAAINGRPDRTARIAVAVRTGVESEPAQLAQLRAAGVPIFEGVERAVRAIGFFAKYGLVPDEEQKSVVNSVRPRLESISCYWRDRTALAAVGVQFNEAKLVGTPQEAAAAACELGFPVVLKLSLPGSGHKLAAGAVRLLLAQADAVERAAAEMLASTPVQPDTQAGLGLVVEQQLAGLAELMLGFHRDAVFGPVVVLGLGGTWTEAIRDTRVMALPASASAIARALRSTRIGAALASRMDIEFAFAELTQRVADWFATSEDVVAVDLNPVLVLPDRRLVAVDARIGTG